MMVDDRQRKVLDINCVFSYCTVRYLFIRLTLSTVMVKNNQQQVVDIYCVFGYCTVSYFFIPLILSTMMVDNDQQKVVDIIVSLVTVLSVIYLCPLLSQH